MIGLRASVQRGLVAMYSVANRSGLLDSRLAEVAFQRSYFLYKYFVEDPFARLVAGRPELFAGGHILDVGANIGYTTTLFARTVDARYRVHAFEPDARNYRWLGHAIQRSGHGDRVVAHRAAVGAREGTVDFWHNAGHHADHRVATDRLRAAVDGPVDQVPLTTLDAVVAAIDWGPVSFVKIDVQGFEPEVLRGMRETISRNRAALHVAVEFMPSAIAELGFDPVEFLAELATELPHIAILERDGSLVDADAAAVLSKTAPGTLGYVDLLCTAAAPQRS
ncbi:MAG TPA: FkbM family methyltransferase [Kofleriaceae bacterium]|nr:FkbM family methyltransferase [Kofleriaceae bacterium]